MSRISNLICGNHVDKPDSPFLAYVSNLNDFDEQLSNYVKAGYVKEKYALP